MQAATEPCKGASTMVGALFYCRIVLGACEVSRDKKAPEQHLIYSGAFDWLWLGAY